MRQRPGSFFFCSIGHMVQRTLLIAAAPHHQGEVNQSPKGHEGALGMVRHPEPLPTAHALLMERREVHFSLCRGTCFSSGHLVAPVFRSLVFLPPVSSSCQDRFAILVFFRAPPVILNAQLTTDAIEVPNTDVDVELFL